MLGRSLHNTLRRLRAKFRRAETEFPFIGSTEFKLAGWPEWNETPEDHFISESGNVLPVFPGYRYSVKAGWKNFTSLVTLDELAREGLLPEAGIRFLGTAKGTRALALSQDEIAQQADAWIRPYAEQFIGGILPPAESAWRNPGTAALEKMIEGSRSGQEQSLAKIERYVPGIRARLQNRPLLEIGFNSGIPCLAWDRLGFKVSARDNGYGTGSHEALAPHIQKQLGGSVDFGFGDIVQGLPCKDGEFAIITSTSVLEHVMDLPAALREMRRLLADDGVLIHSYHPYFGPDGGHALAIPDCPWGHLRLPKHEYEAYMRRFRPHEYDAAISWINQGLNRAHPISDMLAALSSSGFEILLWREDAAQPSMLKGLSPQVVRESLRNYPGISLRDLITRTVSFVAKKTAAV
jgi:SAM-dependent methyltransferase